MISRKALEDLLLTIRNWALKKFWEVSVYDLFIIIKDWMEQVGRDMKKAQAEESNPPHRTHEDQRSSVELAAQLEDNGSSESI